MTLIIDCHGHFTTEPSRHHDFRNAQLAYAEGRGTKPEYSPISDHELREVIEANQLKIQQQRGSDITLLPPRASAMGHHVDDAEIAMEWARISNGNIKRIFELFPQNFAGVCQLPQTVTGDLAPVIAELEHYVSEGFVGFNLNPDPSGGAWSAPPIYDPWWDELWKTAVRTPSACHDPCFGFLRTLSTYYWSSLYKW